MAGITKAEIDMPLTASTTLDSLVNSESESDLIIAPMPNLYFTRDPFAMIGNGVSINRMYSVTRNRETIYGEYIFKYHPDFKDVSAVLPPRLPFHIEGGDILNINEKTLAIGISQRTSPTLSTSSPRTSSGTPTPRSTRILAFDIPVSRAFMHLDTVFTQIDVDKFTIHPAIMGTLRVYETAGDVNIRLNRGHLGHRSWKCSRRGHGQAYSLRWWRSDRRIPRTVERRLQHAVRRSWQSGCLRPQHCHERVLRRNNIDSSRAPRQSCPAAAAAPAA